MRQIERGSRSAGPSESARAERLSAARGPTDIEEGRVVVVTRHPRAGREIDAFGGAARFRGKDVLDIGTGNGRLAFDVARHARRVVGLDPSEDAIHLARLKAARLGLGNVRFTVGSAQELDLGRERFDVAIFSWSL